MFSITTFQNNINTNKEKILKSIKKKKGTINFIWNVKEKRKAIDNEFYKPNEKDQNEENN